MKTIKQSELHQPKKLRDTVNKNRVIKVEHYNDTAFYLLSEREYKRLRGDH